LFIDTFRRFPLFAPNVVVYAFHAFLSGAMSAAKISRIGFDAMPDYFTPAVCANGRKPVNRAFKRIENVAFSRRDNFKSQIIIITAHFTLRHFCNTPYFILS
jgi:hypothetical protein